MIQSFSAEIIIIIALVVIQQSPYSLLVARFLQLPFSTEKTIKYKSDDLLYDSHVIK